MKEASRLFKALADETRLRIIALLADGELCVCDLMAALSLPQSTVSRHLAYLRNAGWVVDRRQGVWMYYRLTGGEKQLQQEMLALLKLRLSESSRAKEDRAALTESIGQKDGPDRC